MTDPHWTSLAKRADRLDMSTLTTRRLSLADHRDAMRLGAEAFGGTPPGESPTTWPPEGQSGWGAFVDDRLVARLSGRHDQSWFDGVGVPTLGIASVTVEAEHRGQGLLDPLFAAVIGESAAPISTLYPTAPGIYRRFGYEIVGARRILEIETARLAGLQSDPGITTRRATESDLPAVHDCYTRWARAQNGPLTRTGPLFAERGILTEHTGVTLALGEEGQVVGYAVWLRGDGYDDGATIRVADFVAGHPGAARALWRVLASFSTVAPRLSMITSGDDVARLVLPTAAWREVKTDHYMLRINDVAGAFTLRRPSRAITADLTFAVRGDRLGRIDGDYALRVADGKVTVARRGSAAAALASQSRTTDDRTAPADLSLRTFSSAGLALAWAGAQSCANLRRAGLLHGPPDDDATWDALFGGRQLHIRDYF